MRSPTILIALLLIVLAFHPQSLGRDDGEVPPPSVLIHAVHPGGSPQWESVVLVNTGSRPTDLSNWTLEDGEGSWRLPWRLTIDPGGMAHVSQNATTHRTLWGVPPEAIALDGGAFGLADRGDDLELRDAKGWIADQVWYGSTTTVAPEGWEGDPVPTPASMPWGRLIQRVGRSDSDTATDWTSWTEPRCGWIDSPWWDDGYDVEATTFVTPEQGYQALVWAIEGARSNISVALYGLTSPHLAATLADRASKGVCVRVLVEADVVGSSKEDARWREGLLAALAGSGVEVHVTYPNEVGTRSRPYRYHHEKYCVIDGATTVLTTENWGSSSFPPPGTSGSGGSRGWGVLVWSEELARDLGSLFDHDMRVSTEPWVEGGVVPVRLPPILADVDVEPRLVPSTLRLLVGPEGWGTGLASLLSVLEDAESTIDVELADIEVLWGLAVSPLVEGLIAATKRGVAVRIIIDPGFDGSGRATLEELLLLAGQEGALGLKGLVASAIPGVSRVHTKGAIIDGKAALLGSMNWVRGSIARNREVDVVITSKESVRSLVQAFEDDWSASLSSGVQGVPRWLMGELLEGWSPSDRHIELDGPLTTSDGEPPEDTSEGGDRLPNWVRAVVVLAIGVSAWALDARFGLASHVSLRLEDLWDMVVRRGRALLAWVNPRAFVRRRRSAPRTTGPRRARGRVSPRGPPRRIRLR
jgi:phosphatidylserine/phosphatidylglycerophosphate/cardiolipin synthase-like enzyme